jgi:hypothetical protein
MKYSALKTVPVFIIILAIVSVDCKKTDDIIGLKIDAGYACGWGAGQDSIEISRDLVTYIFYIPSKSLLPVIKTSRSITGSEWNEITGSFNLAEFTRLKYNECNICVDGCDEWISVKNSQLSHSIRYSKGLVIADVSQLQKILADFRSEFNPL